MPNEFKNNPCRLNLFEVFWLDKAETGIRAINEAIQATKNRAKFGKLTTRDGTELDLSEAQLNRLEKELRDPIARLREEQIAHQIHLFAHDEALAGQLQALVKREEAAGQVRTLLAETQSATLAMVRNYLPPFTPPALADDLPWPEPPAPGAPTREDWDAVILRDQ
jgi:hypothetical protein